MKKLVEQMWKEYGDEVIELEPHFRRLIEELRTKTSLTYPNLPFAPDEKIGGTITLTDAKILYLLIRTIKPKVIFEVGTWIGTSAMIMAEAVKKNGFGKIFTCDFNNYYSLSYEYNEYITYL
ncbi:hypothetical protein CL638_01670, partial [bacterium]|nr:hypothetical protein [bacterium]